MPADNSPQDITLFREKIWGFYHANGRAMPWRDAPTPFNVFLSEMMLQQTQVERVIPKYNAFLYTCDDFELLAELPQSTVLSLWSGLGYNRRALYLHRAANIIVSDHDNKLPDEVDVLTNLPGIGVNTAGAICAYVFNKPVVFVETNIRTVYIDHFFHDKDVDISDTIIKDLVERTLDMEHPREWYWALMDYGSYLKKQGRAQIQRSAHYKKQSVFAGSAREMRGKIIKILVGGPQNIETLKISVDADQRFDAALQSLKRDGLIDISDDDVCLTE